MTDRTILYTGGPMSGRATSINTLLREASIDTPYADHQQPPEGVSLPWRGTIVRLLKWRRGAIALPVSELDAAEREAIANVHGIVWLIDSQEAMQAANEYHFDAIRAELEAVGVDFTRVPVVFQLNKRDLPDVVPAETLRRRFATPRSSYVESVASRARGTVEAFETCLKATGRPDSAQENP